METVLSRSIETRKQQLTDKVCELLRPIAKECGTIWNSTQRMDEVLLAALLKIPTCKMLYVADCRGVQVSSNILRTRIDSSRRGQNLSRRPYMDKKTPATSFLLSSVYISQMDRRPSVTAIHVIENKYGKRLGFVAADFDLESLPEDQIDELDSHVWRQIKGDPAIREQLFSQQRVNSKMDQEINQVHDIIYDLIANRGIFHAKLHYSSSRATLWLYTDPYRYRLHVLDEIINPDVCLAFPSHPYPQEAVVTESQVRKSLVLFNKLRHVDQNIYLRSASINIINAQVGLTFSCDGSHYMDMTEFLSKPLGFWLGS